MAFTGAEMRIENLFAVLYFSLAAATIFGMLGVIGGVWAEKFDNLATVTNFVITPLTFLSGTFYSIERLPGAFQTASYFNPVFYLIDGFRSGFTGFAESNVWIGVAVTGAIMIALWVWCYALFRSGYKLKD
jgi:ABC-2 type transport system permease protein